MVQGQLDVHMQKNEVGPLLHTIYSNQLKMDKDLSQKIHKEVNFHNLQFGNCFFDMKAKAQPTKEKNT